MLCYVSSTFASSIFLLLFLSSFLTHASSCLAFVFFPSSSLSSPSFPSFSSSLFLRFLSSSPTSTLPFPLFLHFFLSYVSSFTFILSPFTPLLLTLKLILSSRLFFSLPLRTTRYGLKYSPYILNSASTFLHLLRYYHIYWKLGDRLGHILQAY